MTRDALRPDLHSPQAELRCKGYPAVFAGGRALPLRLKRGLALLLLLAESGRGWARTQLADTLWPDAAADLGRARLRRLCHETNSAIGLPLLAGDADTLGPVALATDVARVRRAARELLSGAAGDTAALDELLASDSHQFAEGLLLDSDVFQHWLDARRQEHAGLVVRALAAAAERAVADGQPQRAAEIAARLLALETLSDSGHAALIEARARLGDAAGVEAAYFACAELMRGELGMRPSPRIEATYAAAQRLLAHESAAPAPRPQRVPPIRFADTGDGAVAYLELAPRDAAAAGGAAPTLIILFGLWSHVEVAWEEPRIRAILERLARHCRVVLMDRRGTGLSERLAISPSLSGGVEDVDAVRRAVGAQRVWLLGNSVGGTIAIDYASARPQHMHGLLLYGSGARGAWAPDYPWAPSAEQLERWLGELHTAWGQATSWGQFAPSMADDPAAQDWWARMLRQSLSRNSVQLVLRTFARMDVRDRLPGLAVPTLIVQRRGDRIVREGAAHYLAAHIAGAQLLLLPGEDHPLWYGDTAAVLDAMEAFVAAPRG